jgi:MoxR-like ATPase
MRFEGTTGYVATDDLKVAVNAAVTLRRPLLVKGEPGTGKTVLAQQIANAFDAPLIEWNVKSTTKAQQGLYEYDAVSRLRDSQLGDTRVSDISNYIRPISSSPTICSPNSIAWSSMFTKPASASRPPSARS